ncbi:MAG: response regulator [Ignavibacterium sp.]|jgi:CheY-like chemotaxis protein|nr:response regulator [Ignavibacterium sp.]
MKRIIIVEDDRITQQFYSMFFNKNGFNVTVTDDGDKILDTLSNEEVGLILMDINLSNTYLNGVKTDGIKLAQIIKSNEEFKNIPVVLVTAYSLSSQTNKLLNETKAADIITKPILDYNKFLNKINTLITN